MMLQVAYQGEYFHGFAKQPQHRTVEGDIIRALEDIGYSRPLSVASRTDKGVSALCNVIHVQCEKDNLCRRLTSRLDHIWVYGYHEGNYNPRHCQKHYIYFYPGSFPEPLLEQACALCSGMHDFSALCRGTHAHMHKEIQVTYELKSQLILFHFYGRSFLWEMIRRCMTALLSFLTGDMSQEVFVQILEGNIHTKISPAPAENLLLAELIYPFSFIIDRYSYKKMKIAFSNRYQNYLILKTKYEKMLEILEKEKEKEKKKKRKKE